MILGVQIIELWMHLESLESNQEARVLPRATLMLILCSPIFKQASITRYIHAKNKPILDCSRFFLYTCSTVFFSPAFTAFTASKTEAQASFFFSRDTVLENLA